MVILMELSAYQVRDAVAVFVPWGLTMKQQDCYGLCFYRIDNYQLVRPCGLDIGVGEPPAAMAEQDVVAYRIVSDPIGCHPITSGCDAHGIHRYGDEADFADGAIPQAPPSLESGQ